MRRIVQQPAGSPESHKHYKDTVESPVSFAAHASLLTSTDLQILSQLHPTGSAAMWGAKPGKGEVNVKQYANMSPGDFVVFASNKRIFRGGTVTHKFRNAALAESLWQRDEEGETWELMFALDELRELDLTYAEYNTVVGYGANAIVQGFRVLGEEKSAALFEYLSLDSDTYPAVGTASEVAAKIAGLGGETEKLVTTVQRLEQGFLRQSLLPGLEGDCALCGRTFPRKLLIAAHIKKRSECSPQERLDVPHVAMLACKFGCDSLYEEGYLGVDATGGVLVSKFVEDSTAISDYLSALAGRQCAAHTPASADYFSWHRKYTFKATG
ncbi:hypothetical protein [Kineococcus aurantiacus]|uniref:HNH endonuclease n=1 Tax=Kineococcus aurantiacus TaxID=37633 RepID=A0A7Y9DJJ0_9ACTN|nr:hypothetical protein [Kineococcus aurantiacus]NYD20953.1 hypothetical protein [Kineococcus aurantiacus]